MHRARILTAEALSGVRDQMERAGQKLVFTNGCFDLLHAGHVRYLQQARELGHALAVGLNSDRSVRELKGEGRPINAEDDRAEVVAALGCVDYVVIFDGKRATDLLRAVRPQVYAKGGDYTPESLDPDERAILAAADAEVQILPLLPGRSTTAVLERMCQP
ncbi:MAG: adenylyltransferase/cytidyltransferase family protein [Verrucomicrobia bacterium]|jgi:rfaE bifunctional protein nucleotidyltransferase chain/domain|nr:adenylyltransferase/cytidyltransferase family protein [Verrucomicrobiota bacterium]MDA1204239.1 adenylyltransferase/cytidyltransferase family protein [Verrucomicrobiota bacterium]